MPIPLGILAVAGAGISASKYFLAFYDSVTHRTVTYKDSSSVYVIGDYSTDLFIARISDLGVEASQTGLQGTGDQRGKFSGLDSSNNLYIAGESPDASARNKPSVFKYNSSNVLQYQRNFLRSDSSSLNTGGFYVDSSGNAYLVGERSAGIFGNAAWVRKLNSSGVVQHAIEFRKNSGSASFYAVGTDSGSNIYHFGKSLEAAYYGYLVKTNSSGTVSFQKTYIPSSSSVSGSPKMLVDSSGNCYLGMQRGAMTIVKTNSSGTIQWQKQLETNNAITSIQFDNDGDIVVAGTGIIFKIDTSGNLVWQRSMTRAGSNVGFNNISFDSNSDIYFTASSFFGYLPGDGSLTGTYEMDGVSYVYSASSHTFSSPSYTEGTSTYSLNVASASEADLTLSAITPTQTKTLENL